MDDTFIKLMDYGVLGFMVYILLSKVLERLDRIEQCLRELKEYARR